jgi:Ca2+-binding RTX toxin-like protein
MPAPARATLDTIVENLRINWGSVDQGQHRDWSDRSTVEYSFISPVGGSFIGPVELYGVQSMSDTQKNFARLAFELWDDVVPLNIEGNSRSPEITFGYSSTTNDGGTYARTEEEYFGTHLTDASIWLNTGWDTHDEDSDLVFGSYGFLTYLHEIGHSLGLTHPGTYDASDSADPTYADDASYAQDTLKYTVMSYFNANADGSTTDHWGDDGMRKFASTPLLHDIAAMQAIYGVDTTTRTGDTVYGFNSNAGKMIGDVAFNPYSFVENPNPVFCIWDAGGNDTLDASGFGTSQRIFLGEGEFSSIGSLTDNVSIAFGARIENAIGGSGNDTISGNDSNNRLDGGGGDDTLYAHIGVDTLIGGTGNDILWGSGDDSLQGGANDDTYYVAGGDVVTESYGQGTDTVYTELATYSMTAHVDNLTFTNPEFYPTNPHTAYGNSIANVITGTDGVDTFHGNGGNDRLYGRGGNDTLNGGVGDDRLYGEVGNDTLNGNDNADQLFGGENGDILNGGAGNDWLQGDDGNDTLRGDGGGDQLIGGAGKDILTGGADADMFVFNSAADSALVSLFVSTIDNVDTITDFVHGVDRIDLRAIDANAATWNNDLFSFLSSATGYAGDWTGKVWFQQEATWVSSGPFGTGLPIPLNATTTVFASTDTDSAAEFQVKLTGLVSLTASDFLL